MFQIAEVYVDTEAFKQDTGRESIPGLSSQPSKAPCDACPSRKTCASGLACPDFSAFVFNGKLVDSDRRPSGNVYRQVFSEPRQTSEFLAPKVLGLVASGYSYRRIARQLNLSKDTVLDIVKRDRAKRAAAQAAQAS
ncbi:hypothetical protein SAMN02949497_0046 [Methylomagnum ishizawai]|uniref:Homeodomain-like domain-containing protein n=1 Tax=Methylomagnum ishizawai TaxID=1760988 RepID=A0A1Y6DAZ2_9GAMM|nr:helix-turn-helix domain-containing protein [Methylomagnum ishizawai]SMF97783.1 hypothetical protein SAMN02949497_0046 [Methylomagnum ishizawai]